MRWLVENAPCRQAFEAELLTSPPRVHDDQVDAKELVGLLLDQMVQGTAPKLARRAPVGSWATQFDQARDSDAITWRVA